MSTNIIVYGKDSFEKNNIIHVSEHDFKSPPVDTFSIKLAISELNKISKLSINGKLIPELFEYENISMWWFCYSRLTTYFIDNINFINNFLDFIKHKNPKEIRIKDDFSKFDLIKDICLKFNIKFSYSNFQFLKYNLLKKSKLYAKRKGGKFIVPLPKFQIID